MSNKENSEALLEVIDYSLGISGKDILKKNNLSLFAGEINVILGPNGSGKSTLLHSLAGLPINDLRRQGTIRFCGRNIVDLPLKTLAQHRAVLSQNVEVNFPIVVTDLIALSRQGASSSFEENKAIVEECASLMEVENLLDRDFYTLSGGEKQRVQIARVLAQVFPLQAGECKYLLFDEPNNSLDLYYKHFFIERIKEIVSVSKAKLSILLVMHDINLALKCADKIILMDQGQILSSGPTKITLTEENLNKVFHIRPKIHFDEAGEISMIETNI